MFTYEEKPVLTRNELIRIEALRVAVKKYPTANLSILLNHAADLERYIRGEE